jgi:hypothetical protein
MKRFYAKDLIAMGAEGDDPFHSIRNVPSFRAAQDLDAKRARLLGRNKRASLADIVVLGDSIFPQESLKYGLPISAISFTANRVAQGGLVQLIRQTRIYPTSADAPGALITVIPKRIVEIEEIPELNLRSFTGVGDDAVQSIASELKIQGVTATSPDFSFNGAGTTEDPVFVQPHYQLLFADPVGVEKQRQIRQMLRDFDWVASPREAIKIPGFRHIERQIAYFLKVQYWRRINYRDDLDRARTRKHIKPRARHEQTLLGRLANFNIDDRLIVRTYEPETDILLKKHQL